MRKGRPSILPARRAAGFTLIETIIVAAILVGVLMTAGAFFQQNTQVATVQMQVSDMQQSARIGQREIVRLARMAGRGGLPARLAGDGGGFAGKPLPAGPALEVRNNVPNATNIVPLDTDSPLILAGTDVLTVRGVIATPVYQVSPVAANTLVLDDLISPSEGTVKVFDPNPVLQIPQDLSWLEEAIDEGRPEALLLVSPLQDIYAIVEITGGTVVERDADDVPTEIDIEFRIGGSTIANAYLGLSPGGGFPTTLRSVAAVGLLEEHRFFIREERAVAGDAGSDLRPRLTRARFYPGTDTPWDADASNLRLDVADNVRDLQMALAIDTNNDLLLQDDDPSSSADDWLFDDDDDDPTDDNKWNGIGTPPRLYFLRISTLARTDRRDRGYLAPPILGIEDNAWDEGVTAPADEELLERAYHRYLLTTTVDLRNL